MRRINERTYRLLEIRTVLFLKTRIRIIEIVCGIVVWCVFAASPLAAQRLVHVETNVPEAIVFADSVRIGVASQTPFVVANEAQTLTLVRPKSDIWSGSPIIIQLTPADSISSAGGGEVTVKAIFPIDFRLADDPITLRGLDSPNDNSRWIMVAAAGTSVLAGVLAIHFRTQADNRFDDFLETGSPQLKRKVKRLDVQSGVSLGVMQVGVGVIAYRLIF